MHFTSDEHRAATWAGLVSAARAFAGDRGARMRSAADSLWDALHPVGVSWIGFYEIAEAGNTHGAEPGGAMILAPHRDKPACSPIGLHGACGRCWSSGRSLVVTHVGRLGDGYVACDPRDLSEVVVPCRGGDGDGRGGCWGVLDADSFDENCFDEDDAARLHGFLVAAGLTVGDGPAVDVV